MKKTFKKSAQKNKSKTSRSRIPAILADLADCVSLELESGNELKFPQAQKYALCTTQSGCELWVVPRKGARRVKADDVGIERLYERFTGFEVDPVGKLLRLPNIKLVRLDRAISIVYRSDKFGRTATDYIHTFRAPPIVSIDRQKNPRCVAVRGGRIRVTAEGITG